eukprot:TRINITY_DN27660_c0_g1_i1.p1 TRINITY_DN27660_c0_g1~~TRINITY_DN27660_c0_g1_i1.p1  ORF type:complete len:617 (+),score=79.65 TRINITY_DN27660_c0_g1_i1:24-1874(+)
MATKRKEVATRYTTRACDFCKARHLRCDGMDTCFQCKRRNQMCNYTLKNVKRGPKPKKKKARTDGDDDPSYSGGEETAVMSSPGPSWRGRMDDSLGRVPLDYLPMNMVEPSYELVVNAIVTFMEKVSPFHPNNFTPQPQSVFESWKLLASNFQYSKLSDLVEAFVNCVILGHGSRVLGHEVLSSDFSIKAETLAHTLFIAHNTIPPEQYVPFADNLVAASTMLGVLKLESGDFNGARLCFIQGLNVLNMHITTVSPTVAHRLYAHMAGMSCSIADRGHWLSSAHSLGAEGETSANRVILVLLYCCPNLLRDTKNNPFPMLLNIAAKPQLKQEEHNLYQKMVKEIEDTENCINWNVEPSKDSTSECLLSYRIIIDGCRGMVYSQFGLADQSLLYAEKCIGECKALQNGQHNIIYWALPVVLAYSLLIAKSLNNGAIFNEGLPLLAPYCVQYPLVHHMMNILKGTFDGPMEVPPGLVGMGLGMGMDTGMMMGPPFGGMPMGPPMGVPPGLVISPGLPIGGASPLESQPSVNQIITGSTLNTSSNINPSVTMVAPVQLAGPQDPPIPLAHDKPRALDPPEEITKPEQLDPSPFHLPKNEAYENATPAVPYYPIEETRIY